MRQTLRKIVSVLDGQPTGVRGQSLVEMTVTFPLLILMVLSLTEIGFLANNFLILMDVVRAAGRTAVTTHPDPTQWDDFTPGLPQSRNVNRMDCDQPEIVNGLPQPHDTDFHRLGNANVPLNPDPLLYDARAIGYGSKPVNQGEQGPRGQHFMGASGVIPAPKYWGGAGTEAAFGFFDAVACEVTRGFAPLVFNDDSIANSKDDIVVSAVSYQLMVYDGVANAGDPAAYNGAKPPFYTSGPGNHSFGGKDYWITVTGRYPQANRYCVTNFGQPNQAGDVRDPFNFLQNEYNNQWHDDATLDKNPPGGQWGEGFYDTLTGTYSPPLAAGQSQGVRGFVFTGNNLNPDGCYGSRFTVQDIEQRLNLDTNLSLNSRIPNGGAVIVEIFWQHHPLVLGPLFEGFTGNKMDDPVLWVWGWFPLPSVEPTQTPSS
jgi:hypothetical protein